MQSRIAVIFFMVVALVLAVVLGSDIALENYEALSYYVVGLVVIYFLVRGWRNVWWFTALLVFTGVVFHQGFVFDANHLFVLMLLIASALTWLNRELIPLPDLVKAHRMVAVVPIALFLAYGLGSFFYSIVDPYQIRDFSVKSSSKAYFDAFSAMGCLFWLLVFPYSFRMKGNWAAKLVLIMGLGVLGNVIVKGTLYLQGYQAGDGIIDTTEQYVMYVPVINMQAGLYTLRQLAPIVVTITMAIATAPGWWRGAGALAKAMVVGSLCLALVGATFSGGRVTLPFCLGLAVLMLFSRRMLGALFLFGFCGLVIVAFANVFSHEINQDAPLPIARSLQAVMLDKGDAYNTISGSQDTRNAAIKQALIEWQKDDRVLFFGRGVYRITAEEAYFMKSTMGVDGFVFNAMKSGSTHNLVTDLLLQYGIVGLVLYLGAFLAVIIFFFRFTRSIPTDYTVPRALSHAMCIYLPLILVYQLLGGGFMPLVVPFVFGLIRSALPVQAGAGVGTALRPQAYSLGRPIATS